MPTLQRNAKAKPKPRAKKRVTPGRTRRGKTTALPKPRRVRRLRYQHKAWKGGRSTRLQRSRR